MIKPWVGLLVATTFCFGLGVGIILVAELVVPQKIGAGLGLSVGMVTGAIGVGIIAWTWRVEAWIDAHMPEEDDDSYD